MHFNRGYNCAQSVLLAMAEHWGIENELIPKVATGFGGGIGRCGSVCGALVGGIMAIGVKYGSNEPYAEKRREAYELSEKLYRQFQKQHRSVLCKELIGYTLCDPEDLEKARREKVFEERCTVFVGSVVEMLLALSER